MKVLITLTKGWLYIKRLLPIPTRFKTEEARGVMGMTTKEDDFVKIYLLQILMIQSCSLQIRVGFTAKRPMRFKKERQSKGQAIINILQLEKDEGTGCFPIKDIEEDFYIVLATRKGTIKMTSDNFQRIRPSGLIRRYTTGKMMNL